MAAGLTALALGAALLAPAHAATGTDVTAKSAVTPATPTSPGKATRASSAAAARLELTVHRVSDATQQAMDDTFANTSIHTIVNNETNHQLHGILSSACTGDEAASGPTNPVAPTSGAFCWDKGDATTQHWSPQGMTSSGDSDGDGTWGTDRVLVSGWGSHDMTNMGRLALINDTDGAANKYGYRWVLPVIPTSGGTSFARFGSHMGGMVWWGDKLLVTGSLSGDAHHNAIYVFSTKHIYRANTSASWVGRRGSQVSAQGYQYFWPAIGSYSVTSDCNSNDHSADRLPCFDGLSIDRSSSPYTLVANEWVTTGATTQTSRIWRYKLAPTTRLMPIAVNSAGHADPMDVYDTDVVGMQGTLSRTENGEKVLYTADSLWGPQKHGIPWRIPLPATGEQTAAHATTSSGGRTTGQQTWAQHSEGMTFMPDQDRVWSQTEWAVTENGQWQQDNPTGTLVRQRIVFSLPMSDLRSALSP